MVLVWSTAEHVVHHLLRVKSKLAEFVDCHLQLIRISRIFSLMVSRKQRIYDQGCSHLFGKLHP